MNDDAVDAMIAVHNDALGLKCQHDAIYAWRSCLMQTIPRLRKNLAKAEQQAQQHGRGVTKLRKKLDSILLHAKENTATPAASLAP